MSQANNCGTEFHSHTFKLLHQFLLSHGTALTCVSGAGDFKLVLTLTIVRITQLSIHILPICLALSVLPKNVITSIIMRKKKLVFLTTCVEVVCSSSVSRHFNHHCFSCVYFITDLLLLLQSYVQKALLLKPAFPCLTLLQLLHTCCI